METSPNRPQPEPAIRVLLFDPITWIHDWSYEEERTSLAPHGIELLVPSDREERDRMLVDADVVVVSSIDHLTAKHIDKLDRCVGILCYSAGMDAVDVDAANRARIPVTNIRAGTADVADHAVALLLAAWRRIIPMMSEAKLGHWDLEDHPDFREIRRLAGSTLGILGPGAIGQAVAVRARAFGMTTVATYRQPEAADPALPHVPLERLAADSHAVVLTASLNEATTGIINRTFFESARRGLILVNVGRGGLVVEQHLAEALDAGIVAAAALDVREPEPPDPANDLLINRPNVIVTPHAAGVSSESLSSLHRLAAQGIEALLRDGGRL